MPDVQLRQLEILQRALDVEMIKALDRPVSVVGGNR